MKPILGSSLSLVFLALRFITSVGIVSATSQSYEISRSLQSATAYYINASTATLNGNNITVSFPHGNSNNATKYFTFYKRPNTTSSNPADACYSRGGVQIGPTVAASDEIYVLNTVTATSPASATFQLGYIPSTSTIWKNVPTPGGGAEAFLCVRFAYNYSGSSGPNQLVNYREIALSVNVTLQQNFTANNLLTMKAVDPSIDNTNNTVTYSCSAYACPTNTSANITDLAQGEGGNPIRLCFVSNQYPAAIITNIQSLTLSANGGALSQTVLSGGSSSAAGTGILDFVSAPGTCAYGPTYNAINSPNECISYSIIPWAIFTPSSLTSTLVTVSGVCTLQIGGPISNRRSLGDGSSIYNSNANAGATIRASVVSGNHVTTTNSESGSVVRGDDHHKQQQRAVQSSDGTVSYPFQTSVDIGQPPSASTAADLLSFGHGMIGTMMMGSVVYFLTF